MRKADVVAEPAIAAQPVTKGESKSLMVVGDSLSAAHGIPVTQGWVALMQQRFQHQHRPVVVHNVSISGQTAYQGTYRMAAWLQRYQPNYVIIALGANDGLRGVRATVLRQRLKTMVELALKAHANVLLLGVRLPPNYGQRYLQGFAQAFQQVSVDAPIVFEPYMLWGVSDDRQWMQSDQLHPTAAAQPRILNHLWPKILTLIGCQHQTVKPK